VSKRHQSSRRTTYGRRQHEVYQRVQRDRSPESFDAALDDVLPGSLVDRFALMDPRTLRLRYATGD
jgi:hypothetical protein